MKQREYFKRIVVFLLGIIYLIAVSAVFAYAWYGFYRLRITAPFWRRGNYVLIGIYAIVTFMFSKMSGGLRVGFMKKLDNFSNCLQVLKRADFVMATQDEIYRTGVIGQFNLTFELAWKAVGEALRLHGVEGAATGSPREILQLAYRHGFINDEAVWLMMLKKRNMAAHIYDEDKVDEMLLLIRDSFIAAFVVLEKELRDKINEL